MDGQIGTLTQIVEPTFNLTFLTGDLWSNCQWDTIGGVCAWPLPLVELRAITFYDGQELLICPNHYRKWEKENKLYMKHIRTW